MCFFRPFGAWALQRQEERIALKNWQKMWPTHVKGGSGGTKSEVPEMATNYLRRGTHSDFVEKFIAAKQLAREKKKQLKQERAKLRAQRKREAAGSREAEVVKNYMRNLANTKREEKKRKRKAKLLERQYLRNNEVKMEREESRRMRIEELKSAQV